MKPIGPFSVLVVLLLTMTVASVAGSGYGAGSPGVLPSPHPPTLSEGASSLVGTALTGTLTLAYPSGVPVTIKQTSVTLDLCNAAGCTTVTATISHTPSGYAYSFNVPPTMTGTVDIILPAGSLTDQYGISFPSVNTVVGTYTAGSTGTTSGGSPLASMSPSPMRTTNPMEQTTQPQINLLIPTLLALLSIAGVALVAVPTKTS